MNGYPKIFRVWQTKQVSEFSRNNVQMNYWSKGKHSPMFEFCCTDNKCNMHVCWCKDPGRDSMSCTSVGELSTWLQYSLGKQTVSVTAAQNLLSLREERMSDCVHQTDSLLHSVASASDRLGWDTQSSIGPFPPPENGAPTSSPSVGLIMHYQATQHCA
jgi:hypothetical protein